MSANLSYRNGIAQMAYNQVTGEPWHTAGSGLDIPAMLESGLTPREIGTILLGCAGLLGGSVATADGPTTVLAGGQVTEIPERLVLWHPSDDVRIATTLAALAALAGATPERKGGRDSDVTDATILPDGSEIVGMVGNSYASGYMISDLALDLLDAADGGLLPDTAGRIYEGRRMFCDLVSPLHVSFDASPMTRRIKLADSTDGSLAFLAGHGHQRTVCANTMPSETDAFLHKVRHTSGIKDRQSEVLKILLDSAAHSKAWVERMETLARRKVSDSQWKEIRDSFLGIPSDTPEVDLTTQGKNARELLDRLWSGAYKGSDMTDRSTGYAAVNVLTEYDQTHRTVRPRKGITSAFARGIRRLLGGAAEREGSRALALVEAHASEPEIVSAVPQGWDAAIA